MSERHDIVCIYTHYVFYIYFNNVRPVTLARWSCTGCQQMAGEVTRLNIIVTQNATRLQETTLQSIQSHGRLDYI